MLKKDALIKLACSDSAVENLLQKNKAELTEMLGEDFAAMKDYEQNNPHHCYDLLRHTVETAKGIKKEEIKEEYVCDVDSAYKNLRVAALFHDIGKPAVRTFDEKAGVSRYKGHAEKSAEIAQSILTEVGFKKPALKKIIFYIKNHDFFMGFKSAEEVTEDKKKNGCQLINEETVEKAVKKHFDIKSKDGIPGIPNILYIRLSEMMFLCKADASAQSEVAYNRNNKITDTRENKIKRTDEISRILRSEEKTVKETKKAYFFIPYKSNQKFKTVFSDVKKSDCWVPVEKENRYLLKYVADRIDCGDDSGRSFSDQTVCVWRKLNKKIFKNNTEFFKKTFDDTLHIKTFPNNTKLYFKISDVYLFCFNTDINLICLEISFDEKTDFKSAGEALFAIKTLGNKQTIHHSEEGNSFFLSSEQEKKPDKPEKQTDEQKKLKHHLIDEILETSGLGYFQLFIVAAGYSQRLNFFAYFESPLIDEAETLNDCLFRLGHGYKKDLEFSEDSGDVFEVYKNNEICHWSITGESSACLAYPEANPGFINIFRNNISSNYLLMFSLILNQKFTLYRFQTAISEIPFQNRHPETDEISDIQKEFYKFEKNYNFKTVSETPQYQNVYDILYKANRIETLMEDVQEPLDALNSILKEKAENRDNKRESTMNWCLAIISLLTIWSALIDSWSFLEKIDFNSFAELKTAVSEQFMSGNKILIIITFTLWVVVSLIASLRYFLGKINDGRSVVPGKLRALKRRISEKCRRIKARYGKKIRTEKTKQEATNEKNSY